MNWICTAHSGDIHSADVCSCSGRSRAGTGTQLQTPRAQILTCFSISGGGILAQEGFGWRCIQTGNTVSLCIPNSWERRQNRFGDVTKWVKVWTPSSPGRWQLSKVLKAAMAWALEISGPWAEAAACVRDWTGSGRLSPSWEALVPEGEWRTLC